MRYSGKKFREETVHLDGNEYHNCEIRDCKVIYGGGKLPIFSGNGVIDHNEFLFEKAALRTIQFLSLLYRVGNKELIEGIFSTLTGKTN